MFKKIIATSILLSFSIGCIAASEELIRCPKPTHTKDSQWNPGAGWSVVSDGPNNDMTQVPDDADVVREYLVGWLDDNSIICTYKFKDAQSLIIKQDIGCATKNYINDSYSIGFRWSSYICNTKANQLENCGLNICHYSRLNRFDRFS